MNGTQPIVFLNGEMGAALMSFMSEAVALDRSVRAGCGLIVVGQGPKSQQIAKAGAA